MYNQLCHLTDHSLWGVFLLFRCIEDDLFKLFQHKPQHNKGKGKSRYNI